MKPICRDLQERLADEGAQALRGDAAAERHLEECPECFQVLERLARLDETLRAMPALDAPERVVGELLARVEAAAAPVEQPAADAATRGLESLSGTVRPSIRRPVLWGLATAASVLLAAAILTPSLQRARMATVRPSRVPEDPAAPSFAAPVDVPQPGGDETTDAKNSYNLYEVPENRDFGQARRLKDGQAQRLRSMGYVGDTALGAKKGRADEPEGQQAQARLNTTGALDRAAADALRKGDAGEVDVPEDVAVGVSGGVEGGVPSGVAGGVVGGLPEASPGQRAARIGGALEAPRQLRAVEPAYPEVARSARVQGDVVLELVIGGSGRVKNVRVVRSIPLLDAAAIEAVKQWTYAPTLLNGQPVPVILTVTVRFRLPEPPSPKPGSPQDPSADPVGAFLEERAATEGLSFQPARGYWANTYVPGDPGLRVLRARLDAWEESPLSASAGFPSRLHAAAAPPSQPFDPPRTAGLAVYLSADRRGLDKPSRMLVQVGLKGSPRSGGPRPPMNLGLVLDLRGDVPADAAAGVRALVLAFSEAREGGDRFSLIVAGRSGGLLVGPDRFKHGPLAVALDRLLAGRAEGGPALGLAEAVAAAYLAASRCEDPDAALGTSAVVLVTGQPLGDAADALADLAHQGAVAGIPLSALAVGSSAPLPELDRLVLAGQGSRRWLEARSDAARLASAELRAASDVVARAVRLRIRLAPGVRLVEMIGSRRLDDEQAQRVRAAERSIDLRLSRTLGIDSDRGEDEDGIQVVIPAFHAGDAHVILLDVVAPGAGPVVDVSVRYKDLVSLGNGAARASLLVPRLPAGAGTLSAGVLSAGPLERNVLDNLLALRLAESLAAAGSALDAGDVRQATAILERARALRAGLLAGAPGLAGDPELTRDVAMLGEYTQLLAAGAALRPHLAHIADSLRYAGRLKLAPRPGALTLGTV